MSDQVTSPQFSKRSSTAGNPVESVIGPTLVIKGEVTAEEDLLIMGRVEGKIDHNQTLTVHAQGCVKAAVKAKEIQVDGAVEGNMYGTHRVKICETGTVVGNVYAPRVGLMEGATFKGMVDMDSDAAAIESRFAEQISNPQQTSAADIAEPAKTEEAPEPVKLVESARAVDSEKSPKTTKPTPRNGSRKKNTDTSVADENKVDDAAAPESSDE